MEEIKKYLFGWKGKPTTNILDYWGVGAMAYVIILLWVFISIIVSGMKILREPNLWILWAETITTGLMFIVGCYVCYQTMIRHKTLKFVERKEE